jgi:Ca-activated chloride channel homolog
VKIEGMRTWFSHPLALHLLWLLPALTLLGALAWRQRKRALSELGPLTRTGAVTLWESRLRLVRAACWGLGVIGLILAVSGPRWGRDTEQELTAGRDLVVVLDLSRSMLAQDVLPNRLERAKDALYDLSYHVEQRGGHRLALVVFAAHPRIACPLTHDYDHFREAVAEQDAARPHPEIRPTTEDPLSGTRLGAALLRAVEAHDARFRGSQDILLLSDGDDPARDHEWRKGADAARDAGIPVHVIGIGDPETGSLLPGRGDQPLRHEGELVQSRLEEEVLQEIKTRTRGTYTPARTHTIQLGQLFAERIEPGAARDGPADTITIWKARHVWFFAAALVLLTVEMVMARIGTVRARSVSEGLRSPPSLTLQARTALVMVALCLISAAPRSSWEALLRDASEAFARDDFQRALELCEQAAERTTDPGLVAFNKAAALYRLGLIEDDEQRAQAYFHEAARHYRLCLEDAAGERRARALFDLGNALLQQARDTDARLLEQAIGAYEQCLEEPAETGLLDDARHNLELAKVLWLRAKAARASTDPQRDPPELNPGSPQRKPDPGILARDPRFGPGSKGKVRPAQSRPGGTAEGQTPATHPSPPGKGEIPPLPDKDEPTPLSPEDALAHLRAITERIEHERAEHYRRTALPPSRKVKDW